MAQNITRRNFLKGSAIGALGAAGALIPTASLYAKRAPRKAGTRQQPKQTTQYSDVYFR